MVVNELSPSILTAALKLVNAGYTPIPLEGKVPQLPGWQNLTDVTADKVRAWFNQGLLKNVGLLCGEHGGHFVAIDFDGMAGYDLYAEKFPHLIETRTVLTGSGKGKHCYYIVEKLPKSRRAEQVEVKGERVNIEIKSTGTQVVTPPSIHPATGQEYTFAKNIPTMHLPDLDAVEAWLISFKQKPDVSDIPNDAPHAPAPTGKREQAYTLKAYQNELDKLRGAVNGGRNNTLNVVAFDLFGMVKGGWDGIPSEGAIESDLLSIATRLGLEHGEAYATIKSAQRSAPAKPFPALTSTPPAPDKPAAPVRVPPDPSTVLRYGKDVATHYLKRLGGEITYVGNPVRIPMSALHPFGGFAKSIAPGRAIGLIAPSGGGKTTFTETWVDQWLRAGLDVLIWSPEWTADDLFDRRVQRNRGVSYSDMVEFEIYKRDLARGIAPDKCSGKALTGEQIAGTQEVVSEIMRWKGEPVVYQDAEACIEDMFVILQAEIEKRRAAHRRPDVLVIDYAQLVKSHERIFGNVTQELVLKIINFCRRVSIVPMMTSQITKEAQRGVKDGKQVGSESANFLRDDFFSLFMSLNPLYDENEEITGNATLRITKNNTGKLGGVDLINRYELLAWFAAYKEKQS